MTRDDATEDRYRLPAAGQSLVAPGAWLTQTVFTGSLNAMLIADDDRVYVDCNPAAESLLECPRHRILGSRIEDFTAVEFRKQVSAAWAAFLKAGAHEGSWELVAPNGKRIEVEYSATANVTPGRHLSIFVQVAESLGIPSSGGGVDAEKPLSPREREILTRIAMGATGEQIATELFISPETVRTHLRNILQKLGAQTRPHAVALGLQRGEITPPSAGTPPPFR